MIQRPINNQSLLNKSVISEHSFDCIEKHLVHIIRIKINLKSQDLKDMRWECDINIIIIQTNWDDIKIRVQYGNLIGGENSRIWKWRQKIIILLHFNSNFDYYKTISKSVCKNIISWTWTLNINSLFQHFSCLEYKNFNWL